MNHIVSSVKFTNAGHVILQLIQVMRQNVAMSSQPHKFPILTPESCPAQRATLRNGVTPLPYLYK